MNRRLNGSHRVGYWIAILSAAFVAITANASGQTRFEVERTGEAGGASVLFIPGLSTPGEVWTQSVAALGTGVDAHIVTLAGFGDLPASGEGAFVTPVVEELATYLDAHQLDDVTVIGHSMGGQIGLQLAALRPDAVSDIIIVDSAPFFARLFNPAVTPDQAAAYGLSLAGQMAAMPREQFLAMSRQGLAIQSNTPEGQARVSAWLESADQTAVARAMGEVAGGDFRPVLPGVKARVRVLIAWADGMPMSAEDLLAVYRDQYAGLEDVTMQIIADSRHFIMLDQQDRFVAELRTVLGSVE
jgi:pimeloyl-ACP methyl ester carboxylesterase